MGVILGVIFHFIGGFASGSFYMPYKKVKQWSWESLWITGGLFSGSSYHPGCLSYHSRFYGHYPRRFIASDRYYFFNGPVMGNWRVNVRPGCVRYLGVSLGSSIILGLCSVFGALVPSVYYYINPKEGKDTIADLFGTAWGQFVLVGLLLCIVGIIISGKAGGMKDKELGGAKVDASGSEYKITLG